MAKAQRDLGYAPAVPIKEALARTLAYFSDLRAGAGTNGSTGSKAGSAAATVEKKAE